MTIKQQGEAAAASAILATKLGKPVDFTNPFSDEMERREWRNGWNARIAGKARKGEEEGE